MSLISKPKTQQKEKLLAIPRAHWKLSGQSAQFSPQSPFNIHFSVNVTQLNKRMHLKTDGLSTEGDKSYDQTQLLFIKTLIVLGRKGTHLEYKRVCEKTIPLTMKSWQEEKGKQGCGLFLLLSSPGNPSQDCQDRERYGVQLIRRVKSQILTISIWCNLVCGKSQGIHQDFK